MRPFRLGAGLGRNAYPAAWCNLQLSRLTRVARKLTQELESQYFPIVPVSPKTARADLKLIRQETNPGEIRPCSVALDKAWRPAAGDHGRKCQLAPKSGRLKRKEDHDGTDHNARQNQMDRPCEKLDLGICFCPERDCSLDGSDEWNARRRHLETGQGQADHTLVRV